MQEDRKELHKRIITNLLVSAVILLAVIFLLPRLLRFFAPLVVAWIVALIANPLIRFLEDRIKILRKHGSALVIVLVIALIGMGFYLLAILAASQIRALIEELPGIYQSVTSNLQEGFLYLHERYHIVPDDLQKVFNTRENAVSDYIMTALQSMQGGSLTAVGSMVSSLVDFIVLLVLTILSSYFMIVEKENISRELKERMPEGIWNFAHMAKEICLRALGGYFKAHLQIMIIIFIITVIPFAVMGISYGGLLALIIAIVDFLPFFGAGTILGPWAIYKLLTGEYRTGIILIVLYVIIMIVRQLLEPKLVGDSIGINPFEILIFMLIGYRFGGMLGLILGIPIGMLVLAFYREGMFDNLIRGIRILAEDINEYRKY